MGAIGSRHVLVTGGTGLVGSHLARRLTEAGHRVTLLVRPTSDRSRLAGFESRLEWVSGDLRDAASVQAAVRQADPELVYHLASTALNQGHAGPRDHVETIVLGTQHLLEALKDRPGLRIVAAGSAAEYGSGTGVREDQLLRPSTVLGAAKAAAFHLLQAYAQTTGLQPVTLRLFTPYGPGEHPRRLIPYVIVSALAKQEVALTSGEQERDFVYIEDVVDALLAATSPSVAGGSVFNIGSGQGTRVRDVVERVLGLMGNPVQARFGAVPTRADEIVRMSADITAAQAQLGWSPRVPLEEGLRRSIAWFVQRRQPTEAVAGR